MSTCRIFPDWLHSSRALQTPSLRRDIRQALSHTHNVSHKQSQRNRGKRKAKLTCCKGQVPRPCCTAIDSAVVKPGSRKEFPGRRRINQGKVRVQDPLPAPFHFVGRLGGIRSKERVPFLSHKLPVAHERTRGEQRQHMDPVTASQLFDVLST